MSFDLLAWVSLAIVVCNLYMLATSRLTGMIRGVAIQGLPAEHAPPAPAQPGRAHSYVPACCLGHGNQRHRDTRAIFSGPYGTCAWFAKSIPPSAIRLSATYGIITSAFAFYILRKIPFSSVAVSPFHASIAIATAFIGIFLIVARRNVVGQIIGYLVFENSAFILAISIAAFQPLLVEMGVLLDMLVGVFIMVMAVHHIHTKHKTISIQSLERLTR